MCLLGLGFGFAFGFLFCFRVCYVNLFWVVVLLLSVCGFSLNIGLSCVGCLYWFWIFVYLVVLIYWWFGCFADGLTLGFCVVVCLRFVFGL